MGQVYSFKNIQCAISGPGGLISLGNGSGAADEGIEVESNGDISGMQIGADGYGQHSLYADRSGRLTVRLLKTSPTNKQLNQMYQLQTSSSEAHGQNTIVITDTTRGDVITCSQVAFKKAPRLSYAKDAGMNEWEFDCISIDRNLGE